MVPVRKWGEQDPTIEEELSGRIVTGFYNAALNGIASSLNLFGGSVSFMEINYNKENYYKELTNLNYHSIEHQLNPEVYLKQGFLQSAFSRLATGYIPIGLPINHNLQYVDRFLF